MQQQINLFQPVFRREAKVFSAATLAQVLLIATLLIGAGVALLYIQLERHSTTRELLNTQYLNLDKQLSDIESQAGAAQIKTLDEQITVLEGQLTDGAAELSAMQQQVSARSSGYAGLFAALARHPLDGLWLTGIAVRNGQLELRGATLDPELLPQYLAMLTEDPLLTTWSLSTVQMERNPDQAGQVLFVLASGDFAQEAP